MLSMWDETQITRAIVEAYHEKFMRSVESDVLIVGAGPAGLMAAIELAERCYRVVVVEKRLAPGGGLWGGGLGLNEVVIQSECTPLLDSLAVRLERTSGDFILVDAMELASALCLRAVQAGAVVFNLLTFEDVSLHAGTVTGVVVNRSMISGTLPVDPVTLKASVVIDASGHEAVVLQALRKRHLLPATVTMAGEAPMDAPTGERFVVDHAGPVCPGLWVAGMSVCTAFGGPRMGPIFGGMLLSGRKTALDIAASLRSPGATVVST